MAPPIQGQCSAIARDKAKAEGCSSVSFEVATPDAAPWPDETFDAILGFNVLHLVAAREAALQGIHRLLKPEGGFHFQDPSLKEMNPLVRIAVPIMQLFGKAPNVRSLDAKDLEREITAAGFEVIQRERHASRGKDMRPFLVARKR